MVEMACWSILELNYTLSCSQGSSVQNDLQNKHIFLTVTCLHVTLKLKISRNWILSSLRIFGDSLSNFAKVLFYFLLIGYFFKFKQIYCYSVIDFLLKKTYNFLLCILVIQWIWLIYIFNWYHFEFLLKFCFLHFRKL